MVPPDLAVSFTKHIVARWYSEVAQLRTVDKEPTISTASILAGDDPDAPPTVDTARGDAEVDEALLSEM